MNPPDSLAQVAQITLREGRTRAERSETFGFAFRNFLDAFYSADKKTQQLMIQDEPEILRDSLKDGGVADSYLAALANYLASKYGLRPMAWADVSQRHRIPDKPWFALNHPDSRMWLITQSPAAFRERDLFISADGLSRA